MTKRRLGHFEPGFGPVFIRKGLPGKAGEDPVLSVGLT